MPAPVIAWYDSTNTTQLTSIDFGTVDAGSVSSVIQVLIWNNRGGATAVSDATSCTLTTKTQQLGDTGLDVVEEKWEEAQDDKETNPSFVAIGGAADRPVGNGVTPQVVSGAANDGTTANSNANFARASLRWRVPATATAGTRNWYTRFGYNYT